MWRVPSGFYCDSCRGGFYGDPVGLQGVERPCRPCSCNGHIDVNTAGSCDRATGECLRCLNNTTGRFCENCLRGFYHNRSTDACKREDRIQSRVSISGHSIVSDLMFPSAACNCDVRSSESNQCDDLGQCRCRPGFRGLRCDRPNCPTCFDPIKKKVAPEKSGL